MAVTNRDVARVFNEVADLLEVQGANQFRIRAYRRAAQNIESLRDAVATLVAEGKDLSKLEGIGDDLAGKIEEIVETGTLEMLGTERKKVPSGMTQLLQVSGLGPKRVQTIHDELGVDDLEDLKKAAENKRIRGLEGFGSKTEEKILKSIRRVAEREKRFRRYDVVPIAQQLVAALKDVEGTGDVVVAGSYRRCKETVGDLDILAVADDSKGLMEAFTNHEDVNEVVSQGDTRSTVLLYNGLQVDLRVLPAKSYGAAMHYFTGSKAHNIAVRRRAQGRGYKLSEYGLFKDDKQVAGKTEQEVFDAVGLDFVPPELREDRGEIEAAEDGKLPKLVELRHIRGDLHCHTNATDGRDTIRTMAKAAIERGYDYLAITDHTKRTTIANGLDDAAFARHIKKIEKVNDELDDITLLKGAEVDILKDGRLDLREDVLEQLDVVICSLHFASNMDSDKLTDRIIGAMQNPYAQILGHPTNRKINQRDPNELDMERLMQAAADDGWVMEIDSQPQRLDLNDVHARMAKERGVPVVIDSDAHRAENLEFIRYGVDQARRGWLERGDVLNTVSAETLKKRLKRT